MRTKTVPADLSKKIFDREEAFTIIDYGARGIKFEVFLSPEAGPEPRRTNHVCLEVEDRQDLLKKADTLGFKTRNIPKQGDFVVFLEDFDGNLFELKQKA